MDFGTFLPSGFDEKIIAIGAGLLILWKSTSTKGSGVRLTTLCVGGALGYTLGEDIAGRMGLSENFGIVLATVLLPGLLEVAAGLSRQPQKWLEIYKAWKGGK